MAVTETLGYNMAASNSGMTPGIYADYNNRGFQMGVVARSDKGWNTMADVVAAAKSGQDIRFGVMSPRQSDLAIFWVAGC